MGPLFPKWSDTGVIYKMAVQINGFKPGFYFAPGPL